MGSDIYWSAWQDNLNLIKAMTEEMARLCEDMQWEYKIVTNKDVQEGYLPLPRVYHYRQGIPISTYHPLEKINHNFWREGIIIFPFGTDYSVIRELSFAFISGPDLPVEIDNMLVSAKDFDSEKEHSNRNLSGFNVDGYWRDSSMTAYGLSVLILLMKRLWIPSIKVSTDYMEDVSAKYWSEINTLYVHSKSENLQLLRSYSFKEFLNNYLNFTETAKSLKNYPRLFNFFFEFQDSVKDVDSPSFNELKKMMNRKFNADWKKASISALPYLSSNISSYLRNKNIHTLGDLIDTKDKLSFIDHKMLMNSIWFLAAHETVVDDAYIHQFITSYNLKQKTNEENISDCHEYSEKTNKPYPFNPARDYSSLLNMLQSCLNQENPRNLDAVYEIMINISKSDFFSTMSVWPDGLAGLSKDNAIYFFPIWELCADLPIFDQFFDIDLDKINESISEFIDIYMPEFWTSLPEYFEIPKIDERSPIFKTLIHFAGSPENRKVLSTPREANAEIKRENLENLYYWKDSFIYIKRERFFAFSWKLVPAILSFVGENKVKYRFSHLTDNIEDILAVRYSSKLKKEHGIRNLGDIVQQSKQELIYKTGLKGRKGINDRQLGITKIEKYDFSLEFNLIEHLFKRDLPSIWPFINMQISNCVQCLDCLYNQANVKVKANPFCVLRKIKIKNEHEQFCINFVSKHKKLLDERSIIDNIYRIVANEFYGFERL
jgi:hypothetical protein